MFASTVNVSNLETLLFCMVDKATTNGIINTFENMKVDILKYLIKNYIHFTINNNNDHIIHHDEEGMLRTTNIVNQNVSIGTPINNNYNEHIGTDINNGDNNDNHKKNNSGNWNNQNDCTVNDDIDNSNCEIVADIKSMNEKEKKLLNLFENQLFISFRKIPELSNDTLSIVLSFLTFQEKTQTCSIINKQWSHVCKKIHLPYQNLFLNETLLTNNKMTLCDYRRTNDNKFVTGTLTILTSTPLKLNIRYQNINNRTFDQKIEFSQMNILSNRMAFYNSIQKRTIASNHEISTMKNQLINGMVFDIKPSFVCFGINHQIHHIPYKEWKCAFINHIPPDEQDGNGHNNNSGDNGIIQSQKLQRYSQEIPFFIDITQWIITQFANPAFTTFSFDRHNCYYFDFQQKKFIKILNRNMIQLLIHDPNFKIFLEYWIHGDNVDEIALFKSKTTLQEQNNFKQYYSIIQCINNNILKQIEDIKNCLVV